MRKQSNTKNHTSGNGNRAVLRMIALKELEPPPQNTRQQFDRESLKNLTESIRQQGVLQPILVREIKPARAGDPKYQIIAGERRFRAATEAGLKEIPAQVRQMDETEALSAQIVENLQREDVHPLDEAHGYLRLKEEMKLSIRDIARKVAKDARYIARRLALTSLIAEARDDFRQGLITLAHALEICRLAPEIQSEALAACYETTTAPTEEENVYQSVPDKTRPARHVRHLQAWIEENVHLNLSQAPFKLDDARLREDGLTCVNCPQRSGHDKLLFADIRNGETCLNPICFHGKLRAFVQIRKVEVEKKQDKPALLISPYYGAAPEKDGVVSLGEYQIIERKADRCSHAEQAVYADGNEIGQVKWVCRERSCKDHRGRVSNGRAHPATGGLRSAEPEDRHERKQELFDIKVDEVVRKHVMREAIKTYSWPLDREHLNEVVKEFFRRIPSDDQRTIGEVFGWEEAEAGKYRFDNGALLRELAALDDGRLAQFLMLCSFAHCGANKHGSRRVDQSEVVGLSTERGVNHALIDATVRAELCPKKYKVAHQEYLQAVKNGREVRKPVVYERQAKAAQPTVHAAAEKRTGA